MILAPPQQRPAMSPGQIAFTKMAREHLKLADFVVPPSPFKAEQGFIDGYRFPAITCQAIIEGMRSYGIQIGVYWHTHVTNLDEQWSLKGSTIQDGSWFRIRNGQTPEQIGQSALSLPKEHLGILLQEFLLMEWSIRMAAKKSLNLPGMGTLCTGSFQKFGDEFMTGVPLVSNGPFRDSMRQYDDAVVLSLLSGKTSCGSAGTRQVSYPVVPPPVLTQSAGPGKASGPSSGLRLPPYDANWQPLSSEQIDEIWRKLGK